MNASAPSMRLGRPLAWLALALLGQAAALALVDAGPFVRYQHYAVFGLAEGWRVAALLVIAGQAVLVVRALVARSDRTRTLLSCCARGWRLPVIAVATFLVSATVSRDPAFYMAELFFSFTVVLVNLGNVGLVAATVPEERLEAIRRRMEALLGGREPGHGPRLDRFVAWAALWVLLLTAALSVTVYERHPHIPDEISYIYHARYFAEGWATMPAPPVAEAFELDLMTYEDARWYSPVPPGWPGILAVGEKAGGGWLVNPVLSALAILLTYLLVWSIFDRRTARLAVLLLCLSPWFLFMGMSYLTHQASLVVALAACVAMSRFASGGRLAWVWTAGVMLGAVGLVRPLEAVIVGLALGAWALVRGGHGRRVAALASLGVSSMAVTAIHLPYNRHITGSSTYMPIMAYTDAKYGAGSNALGFGPEKGLGWTGLDPFPGHGPVDVLINANLNSFALNVDLFGWSFGSLVVLFVFLASGRMGRRDVALLAALLLVVAVHGLYWFSGGPDFGARYWYLVIIPCVLLTARGIEYLESCTGSPNGTRVLVGFGAAALGALLVFMPWRSVDKYRDYRGMEPGIRELAGELDLGGGLVVVRGFGFPDYSSAAIYNRLDYSDSSPVYVWDRGPDIRRRLAVAFPERRFWVIDGPSVTGDGFRVVAGPLSPEEYVALELPEAVPVDRNP